MTWYQVGIVVLVMLRIYLRLKPSPHTQDHSVPSVFLGKPKERHLPVDPGLVVGLLRSRHGGAMDDGYSRWLVDHAVGLGHSPKTLYNWTVRHGGQSLHLCLAAGLTVAEMAGHLAQKTAPDPDGLALLAAMNDFPSPPSRN